MTSIAASPSPMTVREAIEAAKIVIPHETGMMGAQTGLDLVRRVIRELGEDFPAQPFRLAALMYHCTLEEMTEACQQAGASGLPMALVTGLSVNSLGELLAFGRTLGLGSQHA
jgi:hypothetical protein